MKHWKKTAASMALLMLLALAAPADSEDWSKKGVPTGPPSLDMLDDSAPGSKRWENGSNAVWPVLYGNLRNPAPPFDTRYTQPGPSWPDDVYLWDTAFIAEVWKLWDIDTAKEINRAVLDNALDGMLRHVYAFDNRGRDTQPPVMAWSVWRLYQWDGDLEYIEYAYPILKEYNRWLYENRRHSSGLFFWRHPFESGMDNSPRFTNRAVTEHANMGELAAIDLSSYVVLQNSILAKMAAELGKGGDAIEFAKKSAELQDLVNEKLWHEEDSIYYDRNMETGEYVRIKNIASLLPLFCRVPDDAKAEKLVEHIMDPAEFNTPMPLPSVARDEESFFLDMWRGPVWINTSYMVILGLRDYGYEVEAAEIAFRTADRVFQTYEETGQFWEFYDPERISIKKMHRKTTFLKRLFNDDGPRPKFVGWTGLVNNMVVENLIGLKVCESCWMICPRFPEEADGFRMDIKLPEERIEILIGVSDGGIESCGTCAGEMYNRFPAEPGTCFRISPESYRPFGGSE